MRRSVDSRDDFTGDAAVGNVSGETLLASTLKRIDDELDRVLVLAHIALDRPLAKLARELDIDCRELAARVERALGVLREDETLAARLSDVRRAGQYEHYQALAFRLNLQDWFCSNCAGPMVQRGIGRPRNTCSPRCRSQLHEARGRSWKDQYEPGTLPMTSRMAPERANSVLNTSGGRRKLKAIMRPIEAGLIQTAWREPSLQSRDRAMLLLGFACPIPLAPPDLAALDVNDIARANNGFEVRLFKRAVRTTQYVQVRLGEDPSFCPVRALTTWRSLMVKSGHTTGPLFVRLNRNGELSKGPQRLGSRAIAKVVNEALFEVSKTRTAELSASMLFADFLERLRLDGVQ